MKTLFTLALILLGYFSANAQQQDSTNHSKERVLLDTVRYEVSKDSTEEIEVRINHRKRKNRDIDNIEIQIGDGGVEIKANTKEVDTDYTEMTKEKMEQLQAQYAKTLTSIDQYLSKLNDEYKTYDKKDWSMAENDLDDVEDDLDEIWDFIREYDPSPDASFIKRYRDSRSQYQQTKESLKPQIRKARLKDVKTRWGLADLGFSLYSENSPPLRVDGVDPTELRLGKSVAFTLHIVQQRVNLIDHHLNLIYGAGLQFNTYSFDNPVELLPDRGDVTFEHFPQRSYKKNRLRANYIHLPLMLNYETVPGIKGKSFRIQGGAYLNLLYSANFKTKLDGNKNKTKDNFNLNNFQSGLYGQIGYGAINLYVTYGLNSLFETDENNGYDLRPIGVGIKLLPF